MSLTPQGGPGFWTFPVRYFVGMLLTVLLVLGAVLVLRGETVLPPLAACQADLFEHRKSLIDWQLRAIAAEAQLAQAQGPQAINALQQERAAWERQLRKELQVPEAAVWDGPTKTFVGK